MDYYKILGLIPDADPAVIKAAYKALVSIYHPDRNDDKASGDRIREINEAYAILSEPNKKSEYDAKIEGKKNIATTSAFSTNPPFFNDPLEKDWKMANDFYPKLNEQYDNLAAISWRLAFAFKLQILDSQNYSDSQSIAEKMKLDYLAMYFGNDKEIINYAELLITNKQIDAALELNLIIKVMGKSVSYSIVENNINKKYPELKNELAGRNYYSRLKGMYGFNYSVAQKLIWLHGGDVKRSFFGERITLQLNSSKYVFKDLSEFCHFILKTFASKYDTQ